MISDIMLEFTFDNQVLPGRAMRVHQLRLRTTN